MYLFHTSLLSRGMHLPQSTFQALTVHFSIFFNTHRFVLTVDL